mmetsp:Transcript_218/g.726  ORF Transcript_218/g.726 Transcript_218/m.726 type:complete len:296 (-) Transcript_218:132-1019(-)|eukprot:CAMPEP_0117450284 /NCGR_PEP_ID=MMETSP0759-20121206/8386_1 /TAXON_ID=63605 /ORGANISM="Percolomonas cosmopolitus, Strain WS" /LENGTH=295 /DNA_ID=CAMNT_0005242795 /DNA_START=283 /DNA_END=1170 /DNA_ORIENTATION=+
MTFDTFLFDDEDHHSTMMNIYDDIEPFGGAAAFSGTTPPTHNSSFAVDNMLVQSMKNSVDFGVDKLKQVASTTFQPQTQCHPQHQMQQFQILEQNTKKPLVKATKKKAKKSPSSAMTDDSPADEYESSLTDAQSRKRRRKVSAEEMREKNRLYAKNHRAEKKRRQEELLKRNEQLEKENRYLRRMLMQLGISPSSAQGSTSSGGGFKPVQSIKNVGTSLVKGVKGGIGFMIPSSSTPSTGKPVQVVRAPPQFRLAVGVPPPPTMGAGQAAPQFIIPSQPIVIQAPKPAPQMDGEK